MLHDGVFSKSTLLASNQNRPKNKTLVVNNPNFKDPDREYFKEELRYTHHNNIYVPIVADAPPTKINPPATPPPTPTKVVRKKIVYLTFDDGPSIEITPKIIAILNSYNIKATFFLIGQCIEKYPDLVKTEVNQGFTVANHTYSHNPDYDYADPKNLVADFDKNEGILKGVLPQYNSKIVRFPGGSKMRPRPFVRAVNAAGYKFIDWNCLTSDAENPNYTVDDLFNNYKNTMRNADSLIVLMHDSSAKVNTVKVLPRVIEDLKAKGYTFEMIPQ